MVKRLMLTRLVLITLMMVVSKINPAFAEPFLAGLNAIDRNHFATAFRSFKPMAEEGIEPDIVTYGAMLSALEKAGQWREAQAWRM